VLSPSYLLRLRCALGRLWSASLWGKAAGDGHHPLIRLRHTGRAYPTRLKCDAHLQGWAAGASATCHAGLLVPVAKGLHGTACSGAVPPETHHHTQVAVVFVECSSKTLPACWQLCRKCNDTPLWCAGQGCLPFSLCQDTCTQKLPEEVSDVSVGYSFLDRFD